MKPAVGALNGIVFLAWCQNGSVKYITKIANDPNVFQIHCTWFGYSFFFSPELHHHRRRCRTPCSLSCTCLSYAREKRYECVNKNVYCTLRICTHLGMSHCACVCARKCGHMKIGETLMSTFQYKFYLGRGVVRWRGQQHMRLARAQRFHKGCCVSSGKNNNK